MISLSNFLFSQKLVIVWQFSELRFVYTFYKRISFQKLRIFNFICMVSPENRSQIAANRSAPIADISFHDFLSCLFSQEMLKKLQGRSMVEYLRINISA